MASEPVLSRDVGKRTSRVSQPVIVISSMVPVAPPMYSCVKYIIEAYKGYNMSKRSIDVPLTDTGRIQQSVRERSHETICVEYEKSGRYIHRASCVW